METSLNSIIVGVDEAGRGPLVGNVVAAAVILPKAHTLVLNDSKKLSEKKRNFLYDEIIAQAIDVSVGEATPEEIDALNILQASLLAMKRAVEGLSKATPEMVLVDGNKAPNLPYKTKAIVKGDALVPVISAASIIAKVTRDRQMETLALKHPEYGFAKHKGYPTKAHFEALKQFGVLPEYRKSFAPVKKCLLEASVSH